MSTNNIKILYSFPVNVEREIEEITTREEAGKVITETIKVKKIVPVYFAVKQPSRSDRERAEEERAIWWSKYFDMGIKTEAMLIKSYANDGGILSDAQRMQYAETKSLLLQKMEEYELLKVVKKDDTEAISKTRLELINLRDRILRFEQEQATFFENTAESKARIKLAEWLVVNLSYYRDSEDKPWIPYFTGSNHAEKMALMEKLEDTNDELYRLAQPQLYFVVSFLISSNFSATKTNIDEYLNEAI